MHLESTWIIAFVLASVLAFLWTLLKVGHGSKKALPPGPKGWPLLGNLPMLVAAKDGKPLHQLFSELRDQYGPIVRLKIADKTVVLLNDWKCITDAFVKQGQDFSSKPTNTLVANVTRNQGIIQSNGDLWREHRRFTVMWLRNLGLGKRFMENNISTEVQELCDTIKEMDGKPFCPRTLLFPCVLNVTWSLAVGKRFLMDDPKLYQLMSMMQENIRIAVQAGPLNFMPWLRFIPKIGAPYWKLKANVSAIYEFLNEIIDEHSETLDSGSEYSDLLREYMKEARTQKGQATDTTFSVAQIRRVLTDLFVAGSETTVTTLAWAFLLLAVQPEVQKRVQGEIDEVSGSGSPSLSDSRRMPYTEATIAEIQRFSSIVPFVTHAVLQDTELNGYSIPKDTIILANLWAVMRDPELWTEPDKFDVGRFLNPENNSFAKSDYFIPFSIGKRACLGESLAKAELFLFLTTILQKFTISLPPNAPVSLDHVLGVTMAPKDYKIIARLR